VSCDRGRFLRAPPRIATIYLARRNPQLSPDEFAPRWRSHGELAASYARPGGPQRVVQCLNLRRPDVLAEASTEYDGVALVRQSAPAAIVDMWQGHVARDVLQPDELAVFGAYVRHFTMHAEEIPVKEEGPPEGVAVLGFHRIRRNLDARQVGSDVLEAHDRGSSGFLAAARRVAVNLIFDRAPGFDFDLISELWFRDLDAVSRWADAHWPQYTRLWSDWTDADRAVILLTAVNYSRGG